MTNNQISHQENNYQELSEFPESPRKKTGKSFSWLWGIGGIGLIFVLARPMLLNFNPNNSPAVTQARVLPVETMEVKPIDSYQVSRSYTGEIAAFRTSNLGFSRSGEIETVFVREGDRVIQGQSLAKLDIRNLQTQRQQLVAEKARAQAQLEELQKGARFEQIDAAKAGAKDLEQQLKLKQKQRSRRELLYQEGAISKEDLDEFSFEEGSLRARLSQAMSNLAELENGTRPEQIAAQQATVQELDARIADIDVNIDKSILKAPFDGIVVTRELDEGTVATSGQSVIRLMENAIPEARVGMPHSLANKLIIGSAQTLKLDSQTYRATIAAILPEVNSNTRTQIVVFNLDRSAISQVNPGQTVRIELIQEIDTYGYWLPTDALTRGIRGLWTCYVLSESENTANYQVKQHSVEIIHQQGDRALVRGTLQPGDKIVANGTHRLVPGQQVKVVNNQF